MNAVVTGATGFIGRHLCALLLSEGYTLTAITRNPHQAKTTLPPSISYIGWDETERLTEAVQRADVVFHLAGESVSAQRWTPEFKERIRASRIETTRILVRAGPRALVSASAVGYYGGREDAILTENLPPGTDFLARVCVDWEREARQAIALQGTAVAIVRIGIVLGRDGGPLQAMLHPPFLPFSPWKLGLGGPLGTGCQWMPWVHVEDVVQMLLWCARREGSYNAVAPNPVSNAVFSCALGHVLRRPARLPVPALALRALLGEFADYLLYSQRVVPERALADGFTFHFPTIESALADLLP